MSEPVRVRGDDGGLQFIVVIFRDPATGADLPVKIMFSQMDGMPPAIGAYMLGEHGELYRGAVFRWDDGPHADPRVIYWQAPHCDHDECGSPCEHAAVNP